MLVAPACSLKPDVASIEKPQACQCSSSFGATYKYWNHVSSSLRAYTGWPRTCVNNSALHSWAARCSAAVIRESCKAKTMSERLQRFLCSNVRSRVSYKHDVAENFNRYLQALCLLEVCACCLFSRCPVTTLCALMRTQASACKSRPFTRNNCIPIVRYVCELVCTSPSYAKRVTGAGAKASARAFVLRDLQRPMCCQPSKALVKPIFFACRLRYTAGTDCARSAVRFKARGVL